MTAAHSPREQHADPYLEARELVGAYRADVWTVVLYAACVGVFALATPVAVQALVNTTAFGTVLQPVLVLVLLLMMILVFASVLRALKSWSVEVLQRRLFVDAVSQLAYRLPRADVEVLASAGRGHLVHRFFDLFTLQKAAASLLLGGVDVVLAGGVGMLVLAFYHPVLLAFDIALIGCMLIILFVLGRRGVDTSIAESSRKYELVAFLAELARPNHAFRQRAGISYAHERLDELAQSYLRERAGHFRIVMRQYVGALTTQVLASAGLLALGGWLVIERELTLGQLVAAELIVTSVVSALTDLGKHIETYYDLITANHKLRSLTDIRVERDDQDEASDEIGAGPAQLSIRDLHVQVGNRPLFVGAELELGRGTRVALAGPAESGKSYLLELLYGFKSADRGRITLDGVDVRELSKGAIRERVAVVRGPEIVPGTVLDNVRLARRDISPGRVRAVLEELGLSEELGRLPLGLDTELGPGASALSDSLAWRVTVARAVVRAPGLLAIDADLSAIDPTSLQRVLRVLARPDAPWTLIIVSEHPDVVAHCVERVELRDGGFHRSRSA